MNAKDVMTAEVITVTPGTTVQELAKLLAEKEISGAPVVETDGRSGRHRQRRRSAASRRDRHRAADPAPAVVVARCCRRNRGGARLRQGARPHGQGHYDEQCDRGLRDHRPRRDRDGPRDEAGQAGSGAARRQSRRHRQPGKSGAGIGDDEQPPAIVADADDRTIREKLLGELGKQRWANIWASDVMVRDRIVHLWISDDQPMAERDALRVAAENIPGVQRVEEHLGAGADDSGLLTGDRRA